MRYELRIDMKLKKPVIAYVTENKRTVYTIRGTSIEDVEQEALAWIDEHTPDLEVLDD